jgi:hypothetical protein
VGGLIGYGAAASGIGSSFATGHTRGGNDSHVGGLTGHAYNAVGHVQSYASGDVSGGDRARVGGIVGFADRDCAVTNSWSSGPVSGGAASMVGGIAGVTQSSSGLYHSLAIGRITGGDGATLGGLVATADQTSSATQCHWNTETTGVATSAGGAGATGRTTDEMTFPFAGNTYADWDFANTWESGGEEHHNNGYPLHAWQPDRHTLDFQASAGGTIDGPALQVRIPGAHTAPVTAVPSPGFRFSHWSDGRTDNPRHDRMGTSSRTVTALFSPPASQWILH